MNKSMKVKIKKLVQVKGTVVQGKGGTFLRTAHQRSQLVSDDIKIGKVDRANLQHKSIKSSDVLKSSDGGISDGVERVNFADGSSGYFKPTKGESFVRKTNGQWDKPNLNFQSFHLNGPNNKELSIAEHMAYKRNPTQDGVKGQMIHRELASSMVGKALGMDHLPDVTIRNMNNKTGSLSENLLELHAGGDVKEIKKATISTGGKAMEMIAKTDPKAGDKAMFDFVIGNADRHGGNFFSKVHNDGKHEMLAFDHGFTFPSSNNKHQYSDYFNQAEFDEHMANVKFTDGFVNNLTNFVNSDKYHAIKEYVSNHIGTKEADAFEERMNLVKYQVAKKGARTTAAVGYRTEKYMT